ncbi:histidinol-phosphatase HisJ family protein [Tumebacillus permanentifrigoris]|uniref:histidinol-phosphatase HisJ family protein n=1 Tax=Tumebacillus permanentifrigoris TaxID=378543 RepID=UPI001FE6EB10|nr:histidinol-phosphatase HisJ family protein [Tumebacillus permanentifrigoris]
MDYHTHHERCGHAVGALEEYIEAAMAKGLKEIGLSDHQPLLHVPHIEGSAMRMEEMPGYVEEALALQRKYRGQIDVKVGLEADWVEGYGETVRDLLAKYPFDYVIGSVHFLGDWDHTNSAELERWEGRDVYETYVEYYRQVQLAAASRLFDIIGHLDVIKRFGRKPERSVEDLLEQTVVAARDAGVCVEVNASGLRYPCAEQFPSVRVLEMMKSHGVPLTVGSDAHQPGFVAEGFATVYALLKQVGFTHVHGFTGRKRYEIEL